MANNSYSLDELLVEAKKGNYAIGAFNIFNYISAKAAVDAASESKSPVILQTSMGTVLSLGSKNIFHMVQAIKKDTDVPVILHLDHCRDLPLLKECVDVGWDSVMIDESAKPFEENISITSEAQAYAAKKGVSIEAEIGVISGVEEDVSAAKEVGTNYDDAILFLKKTHINLLAPAVGTAHGIYKTQVNLNYGLVERLADTAGVPIVIHGGTGLSDEQFHHLIKCGAAKINISTALKHAYIDATKDYLAQNTDKYAPIDMDKAVYNAVKNTVKKHIKLFNPNGKC